MSICTCVCTLLWASQLSLRGEQSNEGSDRWTEKQIGDGWTDIKSSHYTGFLSPIRAATLFPPMKTKHISFINTSKGSYRSWKKIVKVWMMMMKERIFAGHPSLALPPLHLASLALASLALVLLALNLLAFAPLTLFN